MSRFFDGARPGTQTACGTGSVEMPILYFRDDCFAAFFTADRRRVEALMPSTQLHPIRIRGGRVLLAVVAFNYIDTTIGPYGEVGVVLPVVHAPRPPPPLLPGLMEAWYPGFGGLVMHLPVTTTAARDAGRSLWGYPKFVADMGFEMTPERATCRVDEGGQHLLTLGVARSGVPIPDRRPVLTYSVRSGELVRTSIPQRGLYRLGVNGPDATLDLGDHPVARQIAALDPSPRPVMTRVYVERCAILPRGEVVGSAQRFDGHLGGDAEGALDVCYLGGR